MITPGQLKIWIESKGGIPERDIEEIIEHNDDILYFYKNPYGIMWMCNHDRYNGEKSGVMIRTDISQILSEVRDYLISEIEK